MSDHSDPENDAVKPRPTSEAAIAAAKGIADISDDESEERNSHEDRAASSPVPEPHNRSRSPSPMQQDPPEDQPPEKEEPESEEETPRIYDYYDREAASYEEQPRSVDVVFLPSSFSFPMPITTKMADFPDAQSPILYRLKPSTPIEKSHADTLMLHIKNNPHILAVADILESNTNLITWSDGSKTLAIGQEQFRMIDDPMASKQFLFRHSHDMQSFQGQVTSVSRVQPSAGSQSGAKLAAVMARAKLAKPAARTMQRCLEQGGEKEEEKAKQESLRSLKDHHRQQAKRARERARTRQHRTVPRLSGRSLDSNDEDSGDEHVRRMEERFDAFQMNRAKRQAPPVRSGVSVKRQKAGGRRVVAYDDEDEDDDDADGLSD